MLQTGGGVAGGLYFIDTCLGFHVGFLGKYNMNKKLVMDGRAIAWYYTTRGNFYVDVITVIAWTAQVRRSQHDKDRFHDQIQCVWLAPGLRSTSAAAAGALALAP